MLDAISRTVPFLNCNDATRIQMACSHARQSVCLLNPEPPYIRTGYEEQYLDYTSFLYRARCDGKVIYRDSDLLIVRYDDSKEDGEVINLGGEVLNYGGFDKRLLSDLKTDDIVKKDQILARHTSINSDGFLQQGRNLMTAYMSHPFGYKDAIPISETAADKMKIKYIHEEVMEFTDLVPITWYNNSEISYPQGTLVNKSDPIFYTKSRNPLNITHVVSSGTPIRAIATGKLYYKVIVDECVKTKREETYYEELYEKEIDKQSKLCEIFDITFKENPLKGDAYKRFYAPQVFNKRSGKSIILVYWIVEEIPVLKGCKLSNRHGNKGVCALIVPDDEMPTLLENGKHVEIIVSPLSVTSRMNVGQLFENHMNSAMKRIYNQAYNLNTLDERKKLILKFLSYIQEPFLNDMFDESFNQEMWDNIVKREGFQIIQRPFHNCTYENLYDGCKFAGMSDDLKDIVTYKGKQYRATVGYNYWYRLEHEPYKKSWGRSVGEYSSLGQPCKGTKAHRLGEMESWCLSAYAANENITEFFVTKSDNLNESARCLKYLHDGAESLYSCHDKSTGIMKILQEYLNACSYNMKIEDDIDTEVINTENTKEEN